MSAVRVRWMGVLPLLVLAVAVGGGCSLGSEPASRSSAPDRPPSQSASSLGEAADPAGPPGYRTTEIEVPKTWEWAMNNEGQVIGVRGGPETTDGFLWDPGTGVSDLGLYLGPVAINDAGQVAGADWDPDVLVGEGWDPAPFLWDPRSGFQDVGMKPTSDFSFRVVGLSDTGQLVGDVSFGPPSEYLEGDRPPGQAAVWDQDRGLVKFGRDGSAAVDVNAHGQVLVVRSRWNESEDDWVRSTFVWTPWGSTEHVFTSEEHYGTDLNDRGQVLITGTDEAFDHELLLWDPRTERVQRVPLESGGSLNDRGQVAGTGPNDQAAVWDPRNGLTLLGTVPGANVSGAGSINNAGQVVGSSSLGGSWTHAFVWDADRGIRDLGKYLPAQVKYLPAPDSQAFEINDRGDILAWSASDPSDDTGTLVIWTSEETREIP